MHADWWTEHIDTAGLDQIKLFIIAMTKGTYATLEFRRI